ncbi:MAG TPA: helix-turn-helix domain-containing protein [Myxococcales bacterium]|nr:helix-turn-helix domain-containing protein [Myxococcales bacterium]
MTFGAWLQQSRSLRELSLEEVARLTRLHPKTLQALEAGDFAALQDRRHALHVARAYASAIGLDPEESALRMEEELQRSLPPPAPSRWQRLWRALPREPMVWAVVVATVVACAALLLYRH